MHILDNIQLPCAERYILLLLAPFWVRNVGLFQKQTLPVLTELVERWGWVACWIGILNGHWQRRPGEQLLVLSQTATESFTGRDGLKRDLRTNIYFGIALKRKEKIFFRKATVMRDIRFCQMEPCSSSRLLRRVTYPPLLLGPAGWLLPADDPPVHPAC